MSSSPDDEVILDPDAARDYLRSWKDRVDRVAASTQAMSDQIGQLRTSATDGNGLVEVTVDSTGVLLDLKLTERIHRVAPDVVSRAVMAALREARLLAAGRAREIAVDTMGPDSLVARTIADRMQQLLQPSEPTTDAPGTWGTGRPTPGFGRQ